MSCILSLFFGRSRRRRNLEWANYHAQDNYLRNLDRANYRAQDNYLNYYDGAEDNNFFCDFCEKTRPMSAIFRVIGCNHYFCSDCVAIHVALALQENITNITCPTFGCERKLEPHQCSSILPPDVFDNWCDALRDDFVLTSEKFYCPYKDCSSLLINELNSEGGHVVLQSECPYCHRLFCAQCRVPWHSYMSCREYQILDKNDVQVQDSKAINFSKGESSNNGIDSCVDEGTFTCDICVDEKPMSTVIRIMGCDHFFCSDCVVKYVISKLQENISTISCPTPRCKGKLEHQHCRSILPPQEFDRWGDILCEGMIPTSEKFYCPFKDCSALLIYDSNVQGGVTLQSECPNCHRLFCAQCRVAWHSELTCDEYKKVNNGEIERDDILLMKLAKDNEWKRCPKCKFFVQRSSGCSFMRCRCKCTFCYHCGTAIKDHYCPNCKR